VNSDGGMASSQASSRVESLVKRAKDSTTDAKKEGKVIIYIAVFYNVSLNSCGFMLDLDLFMLDLFMAAIRNVLEDCSFKIKSQISAEARKVAVDLLTWCSNNANEEKCSAFTTALLEDLNRPIFKSYGGNTFYYIHHNSMGQILEAG